jgi:hypothetical protein
VCCPKTTETESETSTDIGAPNNRQQRQKQQKRLQEQQQEEELMEELQNLQPSFRRETEKFRR